MKNMRYPPLIALLAVMLLGVPAAVGQAIPDHIPDTPGESPADRERERREERHHAALSRFFGATSVSAAPILSGPGLYFDTVLEAGVEIANGDALYLMLGARSATDDPAASRLGPLSSQTDFGGELFALGYELSLARFSTNELVGGSSVSVSVGGFLGDVYMLYVDVSPRYIIRANRYWSLPVGIKMTTSFLGENANPVGTVGVTAGIRRHFGQRKSLK